MIRKSNFLVIIVFSVLFVLIVNATEGGINSTSNETVDVNSSLNITNSTEFVEVINNTLNVTPEINESDIIYSNANNSNINQTNTSTYDGSVNESIVETNTAEDIIQNNESINITNTTEVDIISNVESVADSIINSKNPVTNQSEIIEPVNENLPEDFVIPESIELDEDIKESKEVTASFGVSLTIVG